jgi:hypothetical protein
MNWAIRCTLGGVHHAHHHQIGVQYYRRLQDTIPRALLYRKCIRASPIRVRGSRCASARDWEMADYLSISGAASGGIVSDGSKQAAYLSMKPSGRSTW